MWEPLAFFSKKFNAYTDSLQRLLLLAAYLAVKQFRQMLEQCDLVVLTDQFIRH